ncbi:MAG: DUF2490 domain-containing protein [Ferruginibacter sp.]
MIVKKYCLLLSTFFCLGSLKAQVKQTQNMNQLWLGYFNQTRLSNKWGVWTDVHLRTKENFVNKFSQSVVRFGLTYYLNDATKLTAGYAYISHYPADAHKNITQPEHRPWQQVQWTTKFGKKKMMQWFRLEERFRRKILNDSTLASGSAFNFKLRYNFFFDIPLSAGGIQPGKFSFVVNDEVHVNFGKQIVYNYFDQNRFFLGLKYQVNEHDNVQLGYMNLFQQLPAGNKYKSIDAVRLFYFHNLDLRKKK